MQLPVVRLDELERLDDIALRTPLAPLEAWSAKSNRQGPFASIGWGIQVAALFLGIFVGLALFTAGILIGAIAKSEHGYLRDWELIFVIVALFSGQTLAYLGAGAAVLTRLFTDYSKTGIRVAAAIYLAPMIGLLYLLAAAALILIGWLIVLIVATIIAIMALASGGS